ITACPLRRKLQRGELAVYYRARTERQPDRVSLAGYDRAGARAVASSSLKTLQSLNDLRNVLQKQCLA
ncbi:MAG: hypothetical protein Q7S15_00225, partial [bacterium]|nr:hypothetical protein [bacterium]